MMEKRFDLNVKKMEKKKKAHFIPPLQKQE